MALHASSFLGLEFEPMPTEHAVTHITELASSAAPFGYVVTPNVDHMIRLDDQPELRPLYSGASIRVNDSRILELLAERDGLTLPASPGADIVEALFERVIAPDEPIVVIGSTAEDIAAVKARYGLTNVLWHDAPMGLRHKPQAIAQAAAFMAAHPARFHFLCVGSPQQEIVAMAAKQRGDVSGIGLCCGASLDFLSGRTARAPKWMRQTRLEWLHRMLSEPKRLIKRYLVDGPRIFSIWRRWKQEQNSPASSVQ